MSALIAQLEERRASLIQERDGILDSATAETFTPEVEARVGEHNTEINTLEERVGELRAQAEREDRARHLAPVVVGGEPNPVYRRDDTGVSFFRDIFNAQTRGDVQARERLAASQESRALSTSAGAGGQFAPPEWLIEDFVAFARPGRVYADGVQHDELPSGVSSINLPTVNTGAAVAVQATQNTAVASTDLTTSSVSSGITTIAGQQVVSLQLLQQSGIPFDRVVLGDLARAYASGLDVQTLTGSGASGQLQGVIGLPGVNVITYTQASPAFAGAGQFYSQIIQAINAVNTNRFLPATEIYMHPRRWAWVLNALDAQNRPLVVPDGPAFNQPAVQGGVTAQGYAGTLAGLPVKVDPNIPTNLGSGTNQDAVIVQRSDDLWLFESALQSASFDATYANQASILFRVLGYSAFIPNRYPKSIAVITGTGLVTPTF
ncbi:hypothetical protein ATY41_02745 [Leifsonia xyli subsp. xyli]|nr:phage major capsid protein [Leifsonia xyli]ODA89976.1 hypothetical protein ATY41_02745 [Leifsonia xyli subsp. xyli]